jgi:hypothetical protein
LGQACPRDREDPVGGLHLHLGPGHGVGPSSQPWGGRDQIPEHLTSSHHRRLGQDVPSTGRNPWHHCHSASGVCSLALDWLNSPLHSSWSNRPRPSVGLLATRMAPSPPTDFSSQAMLWQLQGRHDEPKFRCNLTRPTQVCCPVAMSRAHGEADRSTSLEAHLRSHVASPPSTPPTMTRSCTAPQ